MILKIGSGGYATVGSSLAHGQCFCFKARQRRHNGRVAPRSNDDSENWSFGPAHAQCRLTPCEEKSAKLFVSTGVDRCDSSAAKGDLCGQRLNATAKAYCRRRQQYGAMLHDGRTSLNECLGDMLLQCECCVAANPS